MTFSIELQPHEVDRIETALIMLGGHYNRLAKEKGEGTLGGKLYRAKSDEVFKMVCNLPKTTEYVDEIARHEVELSEAAWA